MVLNSGGSGNVMNITPELIERLYKAEKFCADLLRWEAVSKSTYNHFTFHVPVVTIDQTMLRWIGYAQNRKGDYKHGFSLIYCNKYVIRSWDMATKHKSKIEQRYIRGRGRHKHFHLDADAPRDVYEIPEGEISLTDANQAVIDFAKECNIKLVSGYQSLIL